MSRRTERTEPRSSSRAPPASPIFQQAVTDSLFLYSRAACLPAKMGLCIHTVPHIQLRRRHSLMPSKPRFQREIEYTAGEQRPLNGVGWNPRLEHLLDVSHETCEMAMRLAMLEPHQQRKGLIGAFDVEGHREIRHHAGHHKPRRFQTISIVDKEDRWGLCRGPSRAGRPRFAPGDSAVEQLLRPRCLVQVLPHCVILQTPYSCDSGLSRSPTLHHALQRFEHV